MSQKSLYLTNKKHSFYSSFTRCEVYMLDIRGRCEEFPKLRQCWSKRQKERGGGTHKVIEITKCFMETYLGIPQHKFMALNC